MSLAKQLSAIPNVESNAGWSRVDQDSSVEILLPRESGGSYRLNLTPDTFSGIFNKYGESVPTGNHRRGIWGVKEEHGQKILYLCSNASDTRPGSLWFVSAPSLLSPDRIKKLGIGVIIQIFDEGRRTSYAVQDGTIGDCVEGNDRGEYREAAEKFLSEHRMQ
jgi:hypothetical protein